MLKNLQVNFMIITYTNKIWQISYVNINVQHSNLIVQTTELLKPLRSY